jgi:hypothetical protein
VHDRIVAEQASVEHVYNMRGNVLGTLRQVVLVHNERGFTFTCATSQDRYEKTGKEAFEPLFASMTAGSDLIRGDRVMFEYLHSRYPFLKAGGGDAGPVLFHEDTFVHGYLWPPSSHR